MEGLVSPALCESSEDICPTISVSVIIIIISVIWVSPRSFAEYSSSPGSGKGAEKGCIQLTTMSYNQYVSVGPRLRLFTHDGCMPLLSDILDQPVKALRDVGRAPTQGVRLGRA
jgi:hypothetical protein